MQAPKGTAFFCGRLEAPVNIVRLIAIGRQLRNLYDDLHRNLLKVCSGFIWFGHLHSSFLYSAILARLNQYGLTLFKIFTHGLMLAQPQG
jgi:hypothetical protein